MTDLHYYCSVTNSSNISNYIFQDNYISFSLLHSQGIISFTDLLISNDISVNLVISGGGGGGASSGQNGAGDIANMSWGSGSGGGGAGFGKIVLQEISSTYNYTVGSGGKGGVGSTTGAITGVDGANGGNSSFTTPYGKIEATGGGGAPSLWIVYGPPPQAGSSGKLTYPSSSDIIVIYDCSGGNGGIGVNNDSSPGTPSAGSDSTPIQTIEIYDSSNVSFGGGGGGGDASTSPQWDSGTNTWIQPQTSNNGGQAGLNGIRGAIGSSGTLTNKDGGNATSYGSGGGGAGQAGINDSPFSTEWNYYFNNGGSGEDGVIFIKFFTPPVITNYSSYISGSSIFLTKNIEDPEITLSATTIASPTSFDMTMSSVASGINFNSSTGQINVDYNSFPISQITLTITATNEYGTSLNFLLTFIKQANNGCETGAGPDPTRVWTRAVRDCIDISGVGANDQPLSSNGYNLSEKRKAEIFQYRNNNANMSSKQLYSRLARGIGRQRGSTFATQSDSYTNANTKNLQNVNVNTGPLLCPNSRVISAYTSQNNTPGPKMLITNYPNAPLYNYRVRRTFVGGNVKWPQYGPNTGQPRDPKLAGNSGSKPGYQSGNQ